MERQERRRAASTGLMSLNIYLKLVVRSQFSVTVLNLVFQMN